MHKALLSVGVMTLFGAVLATPASAMCGAGQQAQASSSGAMMCGAPTGAAATAETPSTDKPAQKSSGMCPCCGKMAMMKGKPGGMQHNMPGMDMK
jgi:hypothetical protein